MPLLLLLLLLSATAAAAAAAVCHCCCCCCLPLLLLLLLSASQARALLPTCMSSGEWFFCGSALDSEAQVLLPLHEVAAQGARNTTLLAASVHLCALLAKPAPHSWHDKQYACAHAGTVLRLPRSYASSPPTAGDAPCSQPGRVGELARRRLDVAQLPDGLVRAAAHGAVIKVPPPGLEQAATAPQHASSLPEQQQQQQQHHMLTGEGDATCDEDHHAAAAGSASAAARSSARRPPGGSSGGRSGSGGVASAGSSPPPGCVIGSTGIRGVPGKVCCECGATQTPQWREGPQGACCSCCYSAFTPFVLLA